MKQFTTFILIAAIAAVFLPACKPSLSIEDNSFRISMTTETADNGKHNLYLVLEEGNPQLRYRIKYSIDGKKTLPLYLEGGGPLEQDGDITFNSGSVVTLVTGEMQEIPHDISVTLSAGSYSQEASVTTGRGSVFEIESTMELKEEDLHHYLFITLKNGDQGRRYNIEYWINDDRFYHLYDERGNVIGQGSEFSFSQQRLRILKVDRLPEGKNHILIKFTTGIWSRYINRYFSNDISPEITMTLDLKDGDYILTTPDNPNRVEFKGTAEYWAKGIVNVRTGGYTYDGKVKEFTVKRSFITGSPERLELTVGRKDSLAAEIRKNYEWSDIYVKEFVKNEGMVWVCKGQEKKNYFMQHDTLRLAFERDPKQNIGLKVNSQIDNCYINGVRIAKRGIHTVFGNIKDESTVTAM